ncbi:reverse transcriptase domain-containing protein [Rheinheimera soli]|uniref:reverse transcriptase domain-containing protein n=1 Tax=Rheinheimera soli TaxID=443616 RepID=UPI001E46C657|nr:reverse transcriptase domain-containing protein [Rheinheimera soli]
MELKIEQLKTAYLFQKSYTYFENLNLFMKQTISAFECDRFDAKLQTLLEVINSEDICANKDFKKWLDAINFRLLPKGANRPEDKLQNEHNKENGLFLSNVTASEEYEVSKLNYLIEAPAELHIVEMLWCLVVAPALENDMTKDCYGNRLSDAAIAFTDIFTFDPGSTKFEVFKRYFDQYSAWRDKALDSATELLKSGDNAAFLSLDLKSYFYEIEVNFDKIRKVTTKFVDDEILPLAQKLNEALEAIYSHYYLKIKENLDVTHPASSSKKGLPVGFASSAVIANWYLCDFDRAIASKARPEHYGRYVDDILIVFKDPTIKSTNQIESFISEYLAGLIEKSANDANYFIKIDNNSLPLQRDKLILQYFDKEHSRAGLEVFKKEIEERSSAFRFLPEEHIDNELDKFAYDILYDGSANKLRSVVGLAENETELARYLSSHITAHRLSKLDKKDVVIPQLKVFFNGVNAITYSRLWEKVYQYGVILNRPSFVIDFYKMVISEAAKIKFVSDLEALTNAKKGSLTKRLRADLEHYNNLSLSLCLGLLEIDPYERLIQPEFVAAVFSNDGQGILDLPFDEWPSANGLTGLPLFAYHKSLNPFVRDFRQANMIRHSLVAWPLANFTEYKGSLVDDSKFLTSDTFELIQEKIKLSPRFVHFDEYQLFKLNTALKDFSPDSTLSDWQRDSIEKYTSMSGWQDIGVKFDIVDKNFNDTLIVEHLTVGGNVKPSSLRLALGNTQINEIDIEYAAREDKSPNTSFSRQLKLFHLLNSALKEKADLFVLPEVAIPVSWLPFMVAYSRRHQIGMIFGLEHWVVNGKAFNLLIEVLPYKVGNKYNSCIVTARVKNHYAPAEQDMLESLRLVAANEALKPKNYYHRVSWKGISFATYNCFELSDIDHRSIFKSEIDLLVACVWNRDTNYYQHILESAVRDLHCYVVQSNTSQYGGSCVLRPTKTESKTMLYVKGGENSCVLTVELDIDGLRTFQFKSKPNSKDTFKHLPPGYQSIKVRDR